MLLALSIDSLLLCHKVVRCNLDSTPAYLPILIALSPEPIPFPFLQHIGTFLGRLVEFDWSVWIEEWGPEWVYIKASIHYSVFFDFSTWWERKWKVCKSTWRTLVLKNRTRPPGLIKLASLSQITEAEVWVEDTILQASSAVESNGDLSWLMVTLTDRGWVTRTSISRTFSSEPCWLHL